MSASDPLGVRGDFRAAALGTYLDLPATAALPASVEQAGVDFLGMQSEGPISLPGIMQKTAEVRGQFAGLFGAKPEETGFLFATGEAENILVSALDLRAGDNVVVDDLHYTTAYALYRHLEQTRGIELRVVQSVEGRSTPEQFEKLIDRRTRLVSVAWVSNQNGYRHALRPLAGLAHAAGAFFYADAIQALGTFPVDLHDEGVDMISAGTYKWLLGGFGIAPFYLREEHFDRIRPDRIGSFSVAKQQPGYQYRLHEGARGFEYATLAFLPLYQLGASLHYLAGVGLDRIEAHTVPMAQELRTGLAGLGFEVLTPEGNTSPTVVFVHEADPADARALFERERVWVTFRGGGRHIRAGVALFNNREDIQRLLQVAEELRSLPKA